MDSNFWPKEEIKNSQETFNQAWSYQTNYEATPEEGKKFLSLKEKKTEDILWASTFYNYPKVLYPSSATQ